MSDSKAQREARRLQGGPMGRSPVAAPPTDAAELPPDVPGSPADREEAAAAGGDAPFLQLPSFEGPLDLLLHLIQTHELDILDIPVSFITERYLAYIGLMRSMSIDVASEYLVMAATLAHIKSKMLLPSVPADQEDDGLEGILDDPRAELVRRLLEYQKYKAAGVDLADRGTLGRDVFARGSPEPVPEGPAPFAPTSVFSLLDAFDRVLKRANVRVDHEVVFDRISITDRIVQLTEMLTARRALAFEDLFLVPPRDEAGTDGAPVSVTAPTRFELVITFLAVLEMAKLRLIRVYQTDALSPIHVELAVQDAPDEPTGAPPASGADVEIQRPRPGPPSDEVVDDE